MQSDDKDDKFKPIASRNILKSQLKTKLSTLSGDDLATLGFYWHVDTTLKLLLIDRLIKVWNDLPESDFYDDGNDREEKKNNVDSTAGTIVETLLNRARLLRKTSDAAYAQQCLKTSKAGGGREYRARRWGRPNKGCGNGYDFVEQCCIKKVSTWNLDGVEASDPAETSNLLRMKQEELKLEEDLRESEITDKSSVEKEFLFNFIEQVQNKMVRELGSIFDARIATVLPNTELAEFVFPNDNAAPSGGIIGRVGSVLLQGVGEAATAAAAALLAFAQYLIRWLKITLNSTVVWIGKTLITLKTYGQVVATWLTTNPMQARVYLSIAKTVINTLCKRIGDFLAPPEGGGVSFIQFLDGQAQRVIEGQRVGDDKEKLDSREIEMVVLDGKISYKYNNDTTVALGDGYKPLAAYFSDWVSTSQTVVQTLLASGILDPLNIMSSLVQSDLFENFVLPGLGFFTPLPMVGMVGAALSLVVSTVAKSLKTATKEVIEVMAFQNNIQESVAAFINLFNIQDCLAQMPRVRARYRYAYLYLQNLLDRYIRSNLETLGYDALYIQNEARQRLVELNKEWKSERYLLPIRRELVGGGGKNTSAVGFSAYSLQPLLIEPLLIEPLPTTSFF